jgi:gas vesicle protein
MANRGAIGCPKQRTSRDGQRSTLCPCAQAPPPATVTVLGEEHHAMTTPMQEGRNYGFAIGVLTATFVGAGLALLFAPRVSALRNRLTESAKSLGRQTSARVGETVDTLRDNAQDVRDDVADVVARSAHEVERFATAARSDRGVL